MWAIYYKELSSFFSSLVGYVAIGVFLLVTGLFIWVFPESSILDYGYAGLDSFFYIAPYILMFLVPAITMRSLAEERRDGTFELLATRPVTDWAIIAAKLMAGFSIIVLALIPTITYVITVYQLGVTPGNLDVGAVIGSYIGLLLLSLGFSSLGLFASSLGKNQIIAFITAVFLCFFMFSGFDSLSQLLSLQEIDTIVSAIGMNEHYQAIGRGVLDSRDLIYFLNLTILFALFSKIMIGARKW